MFMAIIRGSFHFQKRRRPAFKYTRRRIRPYSTSSIGSAVSPVHKGDYAKSNHTFAQISDKQTSQTTRLAKPSTSPSPPPYRVGVGKAINCAAFTGSQPASHPGSASSFRRYSPLARSSCGYCRWSPGIITPCKEWMEDARGQR